MPERNSAAGACPRAPDRQSPVSQDTTLPDQVFPFREDLRRFALSARLTLRQSVVGMCTSPDSASVPCRNNPATSPTTPHQRATSKARRSAPRAPVAASFFYSGKILRGSRSRTRLSRDEPPEILSIRAPMCFHTRGDRNQEQRTLFSETPNRPG